MSIQRFLPRGLPAALEGLAELAFDLRWNSGEPFDMALPVLRGAGAVNGVGRLHGEVGRGLFAPCSRACHWPRCRWVM